MPEADSYRVSIKPSAWRVSAVAGEWVNHNGPVRTFRTKALAREWAGECSGPRARVWIQDAVPWDGSDADGYLVGDDRQRSTGADRDDARQATLAAPATPARPPSDGTERTVLRDGGRRTDRWSTTLP